MTLYKIILILHIISGFLALVMGLVAMTTKKGAKFHILSGTIYHYSMLGVFLTSSAMFFIKGTPLLFLFLIGIFSYYQVITGIRYLRIQNKPARLKWYDYFCSITGFIAGATMILLGLYFLIKGVDLVGWISISFGLVLFSITLVDILYIFALRKSITRLKKPLVRHISRMGGAYIATFTAFVVTNLSFLPGYIGWFGPTVIGSIFLSYSTRKYHQRTKRVKT
ncbi:hypothetical protein N9B82_04450 [Saprospiraceae bacterium]|nr:hypothetical protein [Saprospiraceae bacterium]